MSIADIHLAKYFDHTNLRLSCSQLDVINLCEEAKKFGFCSVVIYPSFVCEAKMLLDDTEVKVCTVIGFPHGRSDTEIKEAEIVIAARQGADEVDVVMDHSLLKAGYPEMVSLEIRQLVDAAKREKVLLKVIVETSELNDKEKLAALTICEQSEAAFIKTSTGFTETGALVEDIKLFKDNREFIDIKASGGIKTLETAVKLINAGATRLGSSSSVQIMEEFMKKNNNNVIDLKEKR